MTPLSCCAEEMYYSGITLWYHHTEVVERTFEPSSSRLELLYGSGVPVPMGSPQPIAVQAEASTSEANELTRAASSVAEPSQEPSLDELLGLENEPGASTGDATAADLDRKLSGHEIGEAFDQAVRLMGDAAERVGKKNDVSVTTQRVQEDAIKRLDQLIASIEQQQQQQQQQSSSQRQQQQQQQSQKQQQAKNNQQSSQTNDPQAVNAPGLREGVLGENPESARAAWGALPARVRDMLVQGVSDRFSSTYRQMTEEYYKRLAEESGKK